MLFLMCIGKTVVFLEVIPLILMGVNSEQTFPELHSRPKLQTILQGVSITLINRDFKTQLDLF